MKNSQKRVPQPYLTQRFMCNVGCQTQCVQKNLRLKHFSSTAEFKAAIWHRIKLKRQYSLIAYYKKGDFSDPSKCPTPFYDNDQPECNFYIRYEKIDRADYHSVYRLVSYNLFHTHPLVPSISFTLEKERLESSKSL